MNLDSQLFQVQNIGTAWLEQPGIIYQQQAIQRTNQENGTLPTNSIKLLENGGKGVQSFFASYPIRFGRNGAYFQTPYE